MIIGEPDLQVLELWSAFDLTSRKITLDKQLIELRETKTSAVDRRKTLNEETKRFRSLEKNDQLTNITEMLKSYQNEIDLLTKRAKNSEAAFVNLYKALFEVPDPVVTLQNLVNLVKSSSTSNVEISRLQGELRQYEEEFQQLKNQDIKIRTLEEQLKKYQDNIEDKIHESVESSVQEMERHASERVREAQEETQAAERRAHEAAETARHAQLALDRSQMQLLALSTSADRRQADLLAENMLLSEGGARLQGRVLELENALTSLRSAAPHTSSSSTVSALVLSAEEAGLRAREERRLRDSLSELQIEVQLKEEALRAERAKADAALDDRNANCLQLREELIAAKNELAQRPTLAQLQAARQQLRSLQKLVYRVDESDFDPLSPDEDAASTSPLTADSAVADLRLNSADSSLEVVLGSRIRFLETQLTETKRALRDSQARELDATEQLAALRETTAAKNALIAKLEADLESKTQSSDGRRLLGGPVGAACLGGRQHKDDSLGADLSRLLESSSDTAYVAGGSQFSLTTSTQVRGAPSTGLGSGMTGSGMEGGSTAQNGNTNNMVLILQGQRDRYKDKLALVEQELQAAQKRYMAVNLDKERLQKDNIELFGKIRYLQNYGQQQQHGSQSSKRADAGNDWLAIDEEEAGGGRYIEDKNSGSGGSGGGVGGHNNNSDSGGGDGGGGGMHTTTEVSYRASSSESVEIKYRSIYESKLNPFAQFSSAERRRKVAELSLADRLLLSTVTACVGSRAGRSAILVYVTLMHLLVFGTLYFSAHRGYCECPPCFGNSNQAAFNKIG